MSKALDFCRRLLAFVQAQRRETRRARNRPTGLRFRISTKVSSQPRAPSPDGVRNSFQSCSALTGLRVADTVARLPSSRGGARADRHAKRTEKFPRRPHGLDGDARSRGPLRRAAGGLLAVALAKPSNTLRMDLDVKTDRRPRQLGPSVLPDGGRIQSARQTSSGRSQVGGRWKSGWARQGGPKDLLGSRH